ncbi:MAG: helicase-related protein [Magnetovibrionaceae bacterium]
MTILPSTDRFAAILGPTNTGKTHYALSRMLGHGSGMMGFPLRLLARENYERAVRIKGQGQVALITGEEKILPPHARYLFCTVESMPLDRQVDFLGVDEIQMCADPDRGHVFTDRLLRARGRAETLVLGAETVRPLLERLFPDIEVEVRPRLSTLSYAGVKKLTRLPKRTAVVAFSASDVYSLAELIRRQKGGAAVVLGALSPRTRNAQVALYQEGEVDYLVATDAIGMGLNMDVNHVAFAETRKFDGRHARALRADELAQIAGRAGRHMNDGTFGTTGDARGLDGEAVERIESHSFDPLKALQWRNADLRFQSVQALRQSLNKRPEWDGLVRAREADDERALDLLAREQAVAERARHPEAVRLLWDVCQIPDFRKVMSDAHARLLGQIYGHLMDDDGWLPEDWVAAQVDRIDRTDGDIDVLSNRIAAIRTWTYVSHRADWLADAEHWRGRTRTIEDKLSDALHERLTQRFVDKRNAQLVRKLKGDGTLDAAIRPDGRVLVEGIDVGSLEGFRIRHDQQSTKGADRAIAAAAERALAPAIEARVKAFEAEEDSNLDLGLDAEIRWQGAPIGCLEAGPSVLEPAVRVHRSDLLTPPLRDRLRRRMADFVRAQKAERLKALDKARSASLTPAARGLVFQVAEGLGSLARDQAAKGYDLLTTDDRRALRRLGLVLGRWRLYFPSLLKPDAAALRALLFAIHRGQPLPVRVPPADRMSFVREKGDFSGGLLEACGFVALNDRALRIDVLERLAERLWQMAEAEKRGFELAPELASLVGVNGEALPAIVRFVGFQADEKGLWRPKRKRGGKPKAGLNKKAGPKGRKSGPARPARTGVDPDSPFAKLQALLEAGE